MRQLGEGQTEWSCKEQGQLQEAPKLGGVGTLRGYLADVTGDPELDKDLKSPRRP